MISSFGNDINSQKGTMASRYTIYYAKWISYILYQISRYLLLNKSHHFHISGILFTMSEIILNTISYILI